jgi:hypothetical protein
MRRLLFPVLLFASWVVGAQTFQASQFGQLTAMKADHAPIIRQAIQAAEKAGGGVVTLPPGSYWVAVDQSGTALEIPAGVTLDLTGAELRLIENDRRGYQVVLFTGRGKPSAIVGGQIVGDRDRHLGKDGEWGMCISVRGAVDVTIRGTKVFDCWGDGIYVGVAPGADASPARRITIEGVEAGHNRRNNISIVAAVGFRIANAHLHNARGTPPEAGIDLEPNAKDVVEDGEILDVLTEHNASYGFAIDGNVGTVRQITLDRVRSQENGRSGFLLRAASGLRIGAIASARNKGHGLSIVGTSDVGIDSFHAQDNAGSVLYTNNAAAVTLGRVTFSGTPPQVQPVRIDPRSSVKVSP